MKMSTLEMSDPIQVSVPYSVIYSSLGTPTHFILKFMFYSVTYSSLRPPTHFILKFISYSVTYNSLGRPG
jgi:hypothetical protein